MRGEVIKMTAEQEPHGAFDLLNEAVDELKKIDPHDLAGEAVIAASRDKILLDLREGLAYLERLRDQVEGMEGP
jgi:hypothetical protein